MNWFMYVWLGGIVFYLMAIILLVFAIFCGTKAKFKAPENPAVFIANCFRIILFACIPFVNILFAIIILFNMENIAKQTREKLRQALEEKEGE